MATEKKANIPLPVYIITKSGAGYNDEGIQDVCDFVLNSDTSAAGPQGYGIDENTTGILALSGAHLLDPAVLARELKNNPAARVILATRNDGSYTLCAYGPNKNGTPRVIEILEEAEKKGLTSHRALIHAACPEMEAELYGGE